VVSGFFCAVVAVSAGVFENVCTIEVSAMFLVVVSEFFCPVIAVWARVSEEACATEDLTLFLVVVSAFFRLGALGFG
jgi:hypothetical protein